MRLVAWNSNYNNDRKRTVEDNLDILRARLPDVVVLSESSILNDVVPGVESLSAAVAKACGS